MFGWVDEEIGRRVGGKVDGWLAEQIGGRTNERRTCGWINGKVI